MLIDITYSVVFPSSGVTLQGKFQPQPGITAVVGPNGVGKTFMSIELARYLLYGKAALRGTAAGYKKLEASGTFVIRDATYVIKRSVKKEQILDVEGNVLAVGAEAVTKKVIELMGYGLHVFDICNASVQKHADMFGRMTPTDRKRMIDEVVGLASNEVVEKACRAEANTLKREAEALTRQLNAPDKPEKPAGYMPSEKLSEEYSNLRTLYDRAQAVASRMSPAFDIAKPTMRRPHPSSLFDLAQDQREYERNSAKRAELARIIAQDVDVPYSFEQLEAAKQRLTIADMLANEVQCPNCNEKFVPGHGHVVLPDGPDLSLEEITAFSNSLKIKQDVSEAKFALKLLRPVPDRSKELDQLQEAMAAWEVYDIMDAKRQLQRTVNLEAERELRELGDIPSEHDLDYLKEVLMDSRYYERTVADYEKLQAKFDALSTEITELGRLAVEFRKGGEALSDARAELKAHLAPAVARVASSLLSDMTHGALQDVNIDEDMNITVNNQEIETLSGGGETVANLALRLALGQVLVAQTFPVFFGDEMDADTDDTRREAIIEATRSLIDKGHLKQIILVTHRSVDVADHVVTLGDS